MNTDSRSRYPGANVLEIVQTFVASMNVYRARHAVLHPVSFPSPFVTFPTINAAAAGQTRPATKNKRRVPASERDDVVVRPIPPIDAALTGRCLL